MNSLTKLLEKELLQLENDLKHIDIEEDDILKKSEHSINICLNAIKTLKQTVTKHKIKSEKEQIQIFKEIKPKFVSLLIYHLNVYNIETNRPNGLVKIKRKYLQAELNKLKNYFDDNLDFYRYYRTGSTYLDNKYFVRGKTDIRLNLDCHIFESDPKFCTSHDFKVSSILANDLLQVYLENELTKLDYQTASKDNLVPKNMLHWTGSKVALIELLYGLYTTGNFNNGNTDIKTIAAYFEKVFDIELGDYYHAYLELRMRQNPTKFIDTMKDALLRKMEEDDEK